MGREIDESWIEEAIERYQRFQRLQEEFGRAVATADVTVRSPDGLVEVVVASDGVVRDVTISEAAQGRDVRDLSKSVLAAVSSAAEAARWARRRMRQEMFGEFPELVVERGQR